MVSRRRVHSESHLADAKYKQQNHSKTNNASNHPHNSNTMGWFLFCGIGGVVFNALSIWMLIAPAHWFYNLPAGVPDFGPLNEHLVRDVGCAFMVCSVSLLWAAFSPKSRSMGITIATVFNGLHAILHLYEIWAERVHRGHIQLDMPVFVTGIVLLVACVISWIQDYQVVNENDRKRNNGYIPLPTTNRIQIISS
jgi:hypothetical protein